MPTELTTEQLGEYLVPVTIDGKTEMRPLTDVVPAHMRQEDYSRKTAELAERERVLQDQLKNGRQGIQVVEALKKDPKGTLLRIAEAYNVELAESNASDDDGDAEDMDDSVKAELAKRDKAIAVLQQQIEDQRQNSVIDREKDGLRTSFPDANIDAVIQYAAEHNFGEGQLEQAYRAMQFESLVAQGEEMKTKLGDADLDELLEAKARLTELDLGNGGAPELDLGEVNLGEVISFDDAFKASVSELA